MYDFCREKGYITADGITTDVLKEAIRGNNVEVLEDVEDFKWDIIEYFKKVCGNLNIKPEAWGRFHSSLI